MHQQHEAFEAVVGAWWQAGGQREQWLSGGIMWLWRIVLLQVNENERKTLSISTWLAITEASNSVATSVYVEISIVACHISA